MNEKRQSYLVWGKKYQLILRGDGDMHKSILNRSENTLKKVITGPDAENNFIQI